MNKKIKKKEKIDSTLDEKKSTDEVKKSQKKVTKKNTKKKVKKRKNKKELSQNKRVGLFIFVIILVVVIVGICAYAIVRNNQELTPEEAKKNVSEISGYGITIDDLDSNLYKEEFKKLKSNLESDSIDYDAYKESVAKMFVIDLYTIATKINKYDVGGLEFIYPDARENYTTNVTDTLYNYVEDNSDGKRSQNLPVVKSVTINSTEDGTYTIESENTTYSSTTFNMSIEYATDYGYDSTVEVIVINKDNFIYVVEKN